jgi:hypothetical protein
MVSNASSPQTGRGGFFYLVPSGLHVIFHTRSKSLNHFNSLVLLKKPPKSPGGGLISTIINAVAPLGGAWGAVF